jgi:isoquinoline 1-oxidoreductase alpha subunit
MPSITLIVNGAERAVTVAPEVPLIYVLRNDLQLTGTRLGCGLSQCGSCAVLADGKEIRSCMTPVSRVVGKKIHTIEGLPGLWAAKKKVAATPDLLHPVQTAWIEEQVPQCGYCQSGMMIAAADLLERNPNPSVAQIRDWFTNTPPSPHLCRCGTYTGIIAAVQRAAKLMSA